ncbi:hypothetical protein KIN20_032911 [Parelaphostrongylus tenuis]|uniref:Uncharacterized protein n=1 Tax=Parelaphostrongylus tenuis TaxID=148309 RepID=A0AAD5R7P9_PARTN|nr:hypothetical protein KIN20_032911 [Parelaphostrongylus tenuis]
MWRSIGSPRMNSATEFEERMFLSKQMKIPYTFCLDHLSLRNVYTASSIMASPEMADITKTKQIAAGVLGWKNPVSMNTTEIKI